jgi:prepilin-type N-terminal cleavage/methylation domain-containing protein
VITMALVANSREPLPTPSAFTLVELLVTMTIISIVTGLALSGLAGARQRAKIDKTKSTIQKLHEIVMPQYESYLSRRVSGTTAAVRLAAVRLLMVQEMPDQWLDVYPSGALTLPSSATAPTRRYAAYKASLTSAVGTQWTANSTKYEGAECLAMIITRGGFDPDATEAFRTDEMGDIDNDGAPEFWDGWGRPIGFFRWAAGFSSTMQIQNATLNPDPFDPLRASSSLNYPSGTTQTDYALVPLIYSSGPGGATDDLLATASGYKIDASFHWLQNTPILSTRVGSPVAGEITDSAVEADNITNHDLITK